MSLEQIARDMKLGVFPRKSEMTILEDQCNGLYEALQTADAALSMIQAAAVKGVPHGMDLNNVRAIIASAISAKEAPRSDGEHQR